ncbi:hypothetical protein GOP47_0028356 [Adiantum capillus-veneris]|nr:hypothetical protein GOP47_0028356 [Adiantum capillus-veneris]
MKKKEMLSAPPLLLRSDPQLGAPSSSASSFLRAADASESGMEDVEVGIHNNVFASLMPNLFNRLKHCDDTFSEQEFQEIHRLLNLARSEDDVIKGNSLISQTSDKKPQEELNHRPVHSQGDDKANEGMKKTPSLRIQADHANEKENVSPNNPPQRKKLSRRERSSRVTTHRKPFVVDLRSFGSILNNNALGKCEKPQDVHAFWEAADERDASEAIMNKLRGRCEQKEGSGTTSLRRLGVRRKNSQRTTTRLKRFAVELPSCAEQVQSLDQERLEEEDDATEESSFTFLSNPEFRILNETIKQKDEKAQTHGSQLSSCINATAKDMEITHLDQVRDQLDDLDILSDGKSPALNVTENGQFDDGAPDSTALKGEVPECNQASEMVDIDKPKIVSDFVNNLASLNLDRVVVENNDVASVSEMKATPYNRNLAMKRTPFTSPTPPSNPLAAFGLKKETVVEDMSKRRLDFDDSIDLAALDVDLPAHLTQNTTSAEGENVEPAKELLSEPPVFSEGENVESTKAILSEPPVFSEATNCFEQIAVKPPKVTTKRKMHVDIRRNSLEGAGTTWEEGHRRSTRIRSRPLQWWRGERFLKGRVHKSLATVIGIKYLASTPYGPKRGTRSPKFKVESYVSEEYAKKVQFAALY